MQDVLLTVSLGLLASCMMATSNRDSPGSAQTAATLRQAAGDRVLIGTAIMSHHLDDPRLADLVARQFNSLTGENEFKPASLQPRPGEFTFDAADRLADFARQHDMKLIGHTLVWHNQAPKWMFEDESGQPLPRELALENLKHHIDTVVEHFKGRVVGWDVVNEAISDREDEYLRDTPARRAIGDDYIARAFEFAHAADPDVELYYNDYSIEQPNKRKKTLRLIRELQAAGVRIDAVGIQGHWLIDGPETQVIDDAIAAYASLGVKVMITELDVDPLPRRRGAGADLSAIEREGLDPFKDGLPDEMQRKLAERYREIFLVLMKQADAGTLTRITFWGTHDGTSWLNNFPVRGRTNHPLLWDRELSPKPSFHAVIGVLSTPAGAR